MSDAQRLAHSVRYIDALRPAWVKQQLGFDRQRLHTWRQTGIPPKHLPAFVEAIRSLTVDDEKAAPLDRAERLSDDLRLELMRLRRSLMETGATAALDAVSRERLSPLPADVGSCDTSDHPAMPGENGAKQP